MSNPAPDSRFQRLARRACSLPANAPPYARATWEVAIARLRFSTITPQKIEQENHKITRKCRSPDAAEPGDLEHVRRIGPLLGRVAARVPWRSDCLIEALAGQRWLSRCGIATIVVMGVRKTASKPLEAHAWLVYGNHVVTGGDPSGYEAIIRAE
ncbi:lasso peptide biosynthesis B2 protein [Aurantiacibacter marinus]|uniref:lasso peptide biosynthesis B2 protein n=1 Tax=Aurantiacibacter marinus TaxID=874156 RepID=UPI0009E55E66